MTSKDAVAAELWRMLLETLMGHIGRASSILQELGLTPGHMKVLITLEPGQPVPMGALATAFACDASTITWLVDRLEERGFVERRPDAKDRRVKAVALTPDGVRMKRKLEKRLFAPPEPIRSLGMRELTALRDALKSLGEHTPLSAGRST